MVVEESVEQDLERGSVLEPPTTATASGMSWSSGKR